jgi:outer membrane lipase/esterase
MIRRTACVALLAAAPAMAAAQPTSLVFFGDSFIDSGNLGLILGSAGRPFFPSGRASDGPVWSELLATALGRPNDGRASLLGGNNYAVGGATTGTFNVTLGNSTGLLSQVNGYVAAPPAPSAGRMAVIAAGGNDFINAAPNPAASIANVIQAATTLNAAGITQFLIPRSPI